MKKFFAFTILAVILIVTFIFNFSIKNSTSQKMTLKQQKKVQSVQKVIPNDDIAAFSSNTCYKKTYYINGQKVNMYESPSKNSKIKRVLYKDDVIVAYSEESGYIYCEDNYGDKGWIKKTISNLTGAKFKETKYNIDVNLSEQKMYIYKNNVLIKKILCSTGKIGNQETETPLGVFFVQEKGKAFFSNKYDQGGKYYIKFFSNYLIHSIPVDQKGNIIEEEKYKLGNPVSHGCIRVSLIDSEWLFKNIPEGSLVIIHY